MRYLIAAVAALFLASCQTETSPPPTGQSGQVAPILDTPDAVDAASYAKPLEARVANVDLDLALDFDAKKVSGTAALDVIAKPGVEAGHPRQQGAGNCRGHRRRRQAAASGRSARPIPARARR